ncbi:MAG TPA: hypothetical protein VFZ53_04990 [Polyangiaceae bacterium]
MNRWFGIALVVGVFVACSAESEPGGAGGAYCATVLGRLRECDVIDSGRYACSNYGDRAELCEIQCVEDASCADVAEFACSFGGRIARCFQECIGLSPFTCTDGTVIEPYLRCDGSSDCAGDEDEADCSLVNGYKCRNVDDFVDSTLYCDGYDDCADGSDEVPDCVEVHVCDGLSISEAQMCNGIAVCDDGSDEPEECAELACD